MIRINLLPYRSARRKESIRKQLSIFVLSIILICSALFAVSYFQNRKIDTLNANIKKSQQELTRFNAQVKEVDLIKKKLKDLNSKLAIIDSLEKGRNFSIDILKELTIVIVNERMWLTSADISPSKIHFNGYALDDRAIADFMRNLERSSFFTNIDLKGVTMAKMKDIEVRQFVIDADIEKGNPSGK